MAAFLDAVRFTPAAGGTTDWTVSAAVAGYMTPATAGATNGKLYKYRAESANLSEWELGEGTYTSGVLSRTTVLFNSLGTTAKINFAAAPQVAIVALAEDMVPQTLGHIPGEPSNGTAAAGEVGEFVSSSAGVTLGSGTPTNIASIPLTAGEWEITAGFVASGGGTTNMSDLWVSINSVSGTGAFVAGQAYRMRGFTQVDPANASSVGYLKVNLSAPATYYLNAQSVFSGTAVSVTGIIRARRTR